MRTLSLIALFALPLFATADDKKVELEKTKLTLSVDQLNGFGGKLAEGDYRVVFVTHMNSKIWKERVAELAKIQGWKIDNWGKEQAFVTDDNALMTVYWIFLKNKPSFKKISLLESSNDVKMEFIVEGQIDPEHLKTLALGNTLKSVGSRLIFQK